MRALVGYTGFVGSNLLRQSHFDDLYHSRNIHEIRGKSYDTLFCAGAPAVKWLANKEPEADLANIKGLIEELNHCETRRVVLISTVDVYKYPIEVDEETRIEIEYLDAYGKHRFLLEQFVQDHFSNVHIVRLPGLFGKGLKKNIIYDFMHNNALDIIRSDNVFQFYDLERLYKDIEIVMRENLRVVNFATEPVSVSDLAWNVFGKKFEQIPDKPRVLYDMRSKYARFFNNQTNNFYFMSVEEEIQRMKHFVTQSMEG